MAREKVLQFVKGSPFGGAEQSALNLLAGLDRSRWQPVLLHYAGPGLAPFLQRAKDLDIEVHEIGRTRVPDPLSSIAEVPAFLRELQSENPAIFHVHASSPLESRTALIAGYLARVSAVVATVHLFPAMPLGGVSGRLQRWVSSYACCYIAVSSEIAARLHQGFRVPWDKIHVVPNGVSVSHFDVPVDAALRAKLSGGTNRSVVLTTGRLTTQKGHRYLLEAASQVPNAVFVFAGEGPERTALESQARQLGVSDRVTFLGHRHDVPSLLACCDLFVLPSLFEGFPLSILEAMAAGRPIIASAIAGVTEAVVHGETGLLVSPMDSSALAAAVRTLLSDRVLAGRLAATGKARGAGLFSATRMAERVMQIYEQILTAPKNAHVQPAHYA